ncbi:tRNA (adenosine(37)-N6)-dimethylallyltransferase MiaA [Leptolyngbya ohadii]|uniref:tRNA (adenosine(37)-N6)-dimethylallyltransferase MiaA n=1 Tax=Leptolyngbya ohadii TaxID=1962290 RepID=UPI000B59BF7E|nr:tRNA (adenosine(37)-N6)-dimethylallyltransferase MiaA [Leptolyngbya ohadii]
MSHPHTENYPEYNTDVLNPSVPILVVICGATATGKSSLAIDLANRLPGVILSADSRQVYREFDIGTAKPTLAERQQAPHELIDICEPTETLTVADYQAQAQDWIDRLHQSQKAIPLLVGGTGLYIKSIVRGLRIPRVAPQPLLRSQLQAMGQPYCYWLLKQIDPASTQKIHFNDQRRTLRALEVFYVTGQPISQQQGEQPPNYPILQIGLDADWDALTRRIAQRTAQMIAQGFVEEVDRLCRKYGADLPLLNTLGYQEIKQFLNGEISLAEAESLIVLHTRQFAKQQRTWFHADRSIEWFDADDPDLGDRVLGRVEGFVEGFLRSGKSPKSN